VNQHIKDLFDSFIEFIRHSKKTMLLVMVVAVITIAIIILIFMLPIIHDNSLLRNIGILRTTGVKAYGGNIIDENGEQRIDWGTVYPGTLTNRSFYLQSESNVETVFTFETANWTFLDSEGNNVTGSLPSDMDIEDPMNVTWNYTDTPVSPGDEIYVTLTLEPPNDIRFITYLIDEKVEEFSFDIYIYAEQ